METALGIVATLAIAGLAARVAVGEATHQPSTNGPAPAPDAEPVARASAATLDRPAAPLPRTPTITVDRPAPAPIPSEPFAPAPSPLRDPGDGLLVTPFTPPVPPRTPRGSAPPPTTTVDLLPGARIEVVDLPAAVRVNEPVLLPDPNRLIQTEIAIVEGFWPRTIAGLRLALSVMFFGVLFGLGVVLGVRGIVAFFTKVF